MRLAFNKINSIKLREQFICTTVELSSLALPDENTLLGWLPRTLKATTEQKGVLNCSLNLILLILLKASPTAETRFLIDELSFDVDFIPPHFSSIVLLLAVFGSSEVREVTCSDAIANSAWRLDHRHVTDLNIAPGEGLLGCRVQQLT